MSEQGQPDSQPRLLVERRFLPFFITQFLGAFNDNVFKNALIILIAFQGAILPVVLWTEHLLDGRRVVAVRRAMAGYLALSVVVLLGMAFASEQYRLGGRDEIKVVLNGNNEMIRDLRLTERVNVRIDPEHHPWGRSLGYFYRTYMEPWTIPVDGEESYDQ